MALVPPPEEGNVAVVVRVRPTAPSERERATHPSILHVVNQHVLIFNPEESSAHLDSSSTLPARGPKSHGKDLKFVFDRVFGEEATQEEVFQHTTQGVLDSVLNGYNCSVFAYGATGAGKTYTMLGSEESPGIMYLTMVELYNKIEARKEEKSCEVLVSYQEVYNEQIHDLLEPKGPLAIREDPEKGVVVQGLSFHQPTSAKQLLEMLASGNKNRTQHPTDANATSSRSHAIFQVYVKQQDRVGGLARKLQVAKMSLIDLAGSERASVANTKGERLREGANINRSLLALINVINALADAKSKKTHIPYRDSKLTRLLKDSVGGNCRTIMIAAVSPSVLAYEDTYNTLKYASRAKEIKQSLKNNTLTFDSHTCQCSETCEQLRAEVADLRAKLCAYEEAARESQRQVPLAPLSLSLVELSRLEDAVPMTSSLNYQTDSDGAQQEPKAEWPVPVQLESDQEAPVETPPGSPRATQLEPEKLRHLLRGLSSSQTERLLAALLSFTRKQRSLLKAANLLTPDVASEFEELERLVRQETGVSLERATSPRRPAEVSGATLANRTQESCDAEASVTVPSAPVISPALHGLQQLPLPTSPTLMALSPIKKRRRTSETNGASQAGSPCSLEAQVKCQQRCGKGAEAPKALQSPGSPCLKAAAPAPSISSVPSSCTPKSRPVLAAQHRVPLAAVSGALNGCALPAPASPPARALNVTFEICKIDGSPGTAQPAATSEPEFSIWENVQNILNKQNGPLVPKTCIPAVAVRSSSIPKPSSVSTAATLKRRRQENTACPSQGGPQNHVPHLPSSSQRSTKPSRIPEHPSGPLAWKGSRRTTRILSAPSSRPPASTLQPMKLLC